MPENVVDLINKIQSVKGLVDMANILVPVHTEDKEAKECQRV